MNKHDKIIYLLRRNMNKALLSGTTGDEKVERMKTILRMEILLMEYKSDEKEK